MSATHSLQTSSSTEPKKKFGTNLNKLTKPPPPPPSSSLNISSSRGGPSQTSSRNGLLVLTTKRSNSLSVTTGVGSSLLASKSKLNAPPSIAPKPVNTPSLRSESFSAYDTLQKGASSSGGAAVSRGVSNDGSTGVRSSQQTAWGLVNKPSQPVTSTTQVSSVKPVSLPVLAPKGVVSSGYYDRRRVISDEGSKALSADTSKKYSGLHNIQSPKLIVENDTSNVGNTCMVAVSHSDEQQVSTVDLISSAKLSPLRNLARDENVATNKTSELDIVRQNNVQHLDDRDSDVDSPHSSSSITPSDSKHYESNELNGSSIASSTSQAFVCESALDFAAEDHSSSPNIFSAKCAISQSEVVGSLKDKLALDDDDKLNITSYSNASDNSPINDNSFIKEACDEQEQKSRMAKDRIEIRRIEEMALENERKQRAARRLKGHEDESLPSSSIPQNIVITSNGPVTGTSPQKVWRNGKGKAINNTESQSKSEVVLELLGRSKPNSESVKVNSGDSVSSEKSSESNDCVKTLISPNKTFSSLVGGSKQASDNNKKEGELMSERQVEDSHNPPALNPSLVPYRDPSSYGVHEAVDEQPPVPFIQLSSYDDRDRGERSGPRMLFDPKSGSMVAAPSDKRSHHYGDDIVKNRKDRNKMKVRLGRDRDKEISQQVFMAKRQEQLVLVNDEFVRRSKKFEEAAFDDLGDPRMSRRTRRKEDISVMRKERKSFDRNDATVAFSNAVPFLAEDSDAYTNSLNTPNKRYSSRVSSQKQVNNLDKLKIPRTCGVLYKLDHGIYVCADGCEADQGYGAHSVPGGRLKNPQAHAKYLEHQLKQRHNISEENSTMNKVAYNGAKFSNDALHLTDTYNMNGSFHNAAYGQSGKRTPKRIDMHSRKMAYAQIDPSMDFQNNASNKVEERNLLTDLSDYSLHVSSQVRQNTKKIDVNYSLPPSLRVKPGENISIITGDPESPELQATANPWAPNYVALAAAAAATSATPNTTTTTSDLCQQPRDFDIVSTNIMHVIKDNDSEDEDENETNQNFDGLGFDPTENMDTVIMSPSILSEPADVEGIDLKSVSLNAAGSENLRPFAPLSSPSHFLDASTWATGGSLSRPSGGIGALGSVPMGSVNWNLLSTERKDATLRNVHNASSNPTSATAASFLSLSPLNRSGVNWGSGGLGTGLNDVAGVSLQRTHSKGSGEASE